MNETCKKCPYKYARGLYVNGYGNKDAKYIIVGEAPGKTDVGTKRPFSGRSGNLLFRVLKELGLNRNDFYTTNALKCFVRAPNLSAVRDCANEYLLDELNECKNKELIIALGSKAFEYLLPNVKKGVIVNSGQIYWSDIAECDVLVCPHPAFVLRKHNDKNYSLFKSSLERIVKNYNPPKEIPYAVITKRSQIKEIDTSGLITCDLETEGLNWLNQEIMEVGIYDGKTAWIIPRENLDWPECKEFFLNTPMCYHNGTFDIKWLKKLYGDWPRINHDTMIMAYALDETLSASKKGDRQYGGYSLKRLGALELGFHQYDAEVKEIANSIGWSSVPTNILRKYLAMDVYVTYQLASKYLKKGLPKFYYEILIPLFNEKTKIEYKGINIDKDLARNIFKSANRKLKKMEKELQILSEYKNIRAEKMSTFNSQIKHWKSKLAGAKNNILALNKHLKQAKKDYKYWKDRLEYKPNSYVHNQIIFAHFCGHEVKKTDADTMEELLKETGHPFFTKLLQYKKLHKLVSTYVRPYTGIEDYKTLLWSDDLIHPTFNVHGTVSGRLSSARPNFQNIPKSLRMLFIPYDNHSKIGEWDYSQLEFKVIVVKAGAKETIDEIKAGKDMHNITLVRMQEHKPNAVRRDAKGVNFLCCYDGSNEELARLMEMTMREAIEFRAKYFGMIDDWKREVREFVDKHGYVETPYGRRRHFPVINRWNRAEVHRQAVNFLIQSTASDIMLKCLIKLIPLLPTMGADIIGTVHDCVVVSFNGEKIVKETIENIMEAKPEWSPIKFTVDCEIGERWHS